MPIATQRSIIGVAKEATPLTGVVATSYLRVSKFDPHDKYPTVTDDGWRGSATDEYDEVQTTRSADITASGNVFIDEIGWWIARMLGDVTNTGTTQAPTGTLSASSIVGAVTLSSSVSIPASTLIQVDVGLLAETVTTSAVSGSGPYTITVPALTKAHASGVAITAIVAPFTSKMSLLNSGQQQPTAVTLTDFDGIDTRQYAGSMFSALTLKFGADGLFTFDATANSDAGQVVSSVTQAYTTTSPVAAWQGAVSLGGSSVGYVLDGEINFKRTVTVDHSVQGVQKPWKIFAGPLSVEGKLTILPEDLTEYTRYVNNTAIASVVTFTQGSSSLALQMSKVKYTDANPDRGSDQLKFPVTFKALANTTDVGSSAGFSPILATLVNTITPGTYA